MRLADSGFLVALFQSGDRNCAAAEREAMRPGPILVIAEVLGETLGILQKRNGIDFARMVKQGLESKPHFQSAFTQRSHFDPAARVFAKSPERLNNVDALLVAWTLSVPARLQTFDEGLLRAAKRESS